MRTINQTILQAGLTIVIYGLFQTSSAATGGCIAHASPKIVTQLAHVHRTFSKAELSVFSAVDDGDAKTLDGILSDAPRLANASFVRASVLHASVENNDLAAARVLLSHGANPNTRDRVGFSPLAYAVEYSSLDMARLLVSHGARIDWENGNDHTNLLSVALYRRYCPPMNEQTLVYLLELGVNTNYISRVMFKKIMKADFVQVMMILLQKKLDLKDRTYSDAYALARSERMKSLLLKYGAKRYTRSNDEPTPLARLVYRHDANGILHLLDSSYDLSQERPDLLKHVVEQGLPFEVFKKLVATGMDFNHEIRVDHNYLIHVAAQGKSTEICAYLLEKNPAFLEMQDMSGQRPLHIAAGAGRLDTVKLLVQKGAKIDPVDSRGKTPLYLARGGVANYLISHGANINHIDGYKRTLLFYAIKNRDQNLVQRLLRLGTNVNQQDTLGNTPLMYAAYYGQPNAAFLLANSKKIDLNARNHIGETALIIAAGKGDTEIVRFLLHHNANKKIRTHITGRRFRARVVLNGKSVWEAHGNPHGINLEPGEPEYISANSGQPRNISADHQPHGVTTVSNGRRITVLAPGNSYAFAVRGPGLTSAGVMVKPGALYQDDTALSRAKRHGHSEIVSLLQGKGK